MLDFTNIKLVLYDFDDTLCIHSNRDYDINDEYELDLTIYKGDKNPWHNYKKNKHMQKMINLCKDLGIAQGLISVVSTFKHMQAKHQWCFDNYEVDLGNFCVGTDEEKIRQLCIIADAYGFERNQVVIIDDKFAILNEASKLGFTALSPMEVVNFIEEHEENNK